MNNEKWLYSVMISLGIFAFIWTSYTSNKVERKVQEIELSYVDSLDITLNIILFEDSVYNYIKELNIKHPDLVFRQARLESANFTSNVFKSNNNMFGFKQAFKRANTQNGVLGSYAYYNTWQDCVIDYALYQTYSAKNLTEEQYIQFLGKHYAEDPKYSQKLRR